MPEKCFNPRTRTGCDAGFRPNIQSITGFNPRTRTGCDKLKNILCLSSCLFQSTHPHGVRLASGFPPYFTNSVSIHAPARGATSLNSIPTKTTFGFNPRTRTGCDQVYMVNVNSARGFNPRTRTGCDGLGRRNHQR